MKKLLVSILMSAMIFSLAACGSNDDAAASADEAPVEEITEEEAPEEELVEEDVTIASPVTEYASLEELNLAAGTNIPSIPTMGVIDDYFQTINCGDYVIAEYFFTIGDYDYSIRCAYVDDADISGLYIGDDSAFTPVAEADIEYAEDGSFYAQRWFADGAQYVFSGFSNGKMTYDEFLDMADEVYNITLNIDSDSLYDYSWLEGNYYDYNYERTTATITAYSDYVYIDIVKGDTALECYEWTMTAYEEDGCLYYVDCAKYDVVYSEDAEGNIYCDTTPYYEDASGYFVINDDGSLSWSGAEDEECINSLFVRY